MVTAIAVHNPATEEIIAEVPTSSSAQVDEAVAAARAAFEGWSATSRSERAGYLTALRSALHGRADEMAALITAEMGAPITISRRVQVGLRSGCSAR